MKKKILGGLFVVAIAVVAAFNVNMNIENNEMSLLALANVEVLAAPEWDGVDIRDKQVWIVNYTSPQEYECIQGGSKTCRF